MLNDLLRQRVKRVYTIGAAAAKIESQIKGVEIVHAETLENALRKANAAAVAGDVVLLAPACASFDQFKNYEQRGLVFKETCAAVELKARSQRRDENAEKDGESRAFLENALRRPYPDSVPFFRH